jgi:chromosomal replication initiation ATPase DnaA
VTANAWDAICTQIRTHLEEEDFRRWFGATAYASDSGDQISVWVTSEAIRRHLANHFQRTIDDALTAIGRPGIHVRFIVAGMSDDEDDDDG